MLALELVPVCSSLTVDTVGDGDDLIEEDDEDDGEDDDEDDAGGPSMFQLDCGHCWLGSAAWLSSQQL